MKVRKEWQLWLLDLLMQDVSQLISDTLNRYAFAECDLLKWLIPEQIPHYLPLEPHISIIPELSALRKPGTGYIHLWDYLTGHESRGLLAAKRRSSTQKLRAVVLLVLGQHEVVHVEAEVELWHEGAMGGQTLERNRFFIELPTNNYSRC